MSGFRNRMDTLREEVRKKKEENSRLKKDFEENENKLSIFSKERFFPCSIIKGTNRLITPTVNKIMITMVIITATLSFNLHFFRKNLTIGLPIKEITKAIII